MLTPHLPHLSIHNRVCPPRPWTPPCSCRSSGTERGLQCSGRRAPTPPRNCQWKNMTLRAMPMASEAAPPRIRQGLPSAFAQVAPLHVHLLLLRPGPDSLLKVHLYTLVSYSFYLARHRSSGGNANARGLLIHARASLSLYTTQHDHSTGAPVPAPRRQWPGRRCSRTGAATSPQQAAPPAGTNPGSYISPCVKSRTAPSPMRLARSWARRW
jgi:hypothetical protein